MRSALRSQSTTGAQLAVEGIAHDHDLVQCKGGWHAHVFVGMFAGSGHAHEDVGMPPKTAKTIRTYGYVRRTERTLGKDMKRVPFESSWPDSVKLSHHYDGLEFWGDRSAPGYTNAYRNRFQVTIDLVSAAAKPPARVLDLAAAQGNFTLRLAEMGYQVVWNDLRAELADYVRLKHESGHVEYVPGNVFELSTDLPPFDVVLATEIIEHVAHPDAFLARLATLLKPDGTIVLTTPNGGYFRNNLPRFSDCPDPSVYESVQFQPNADGHIFLLHVDEMHTLAAKAGLRVETLVLFTNSLSNGHIKTAPLLRVLPTGLVNLLEGQTRRLPGRLGRTLNVQMAASLKRA
jgi:2-polyprenyl-3-methyl-5-hydroxy-6-metoxy-1,4-benzoquinol methylase